MKEEAIIDHLFRHQFGKMVSILTRIFGLSHLEIIEDAVQDTFVKAMLAWRNKKPENPEAWLTQAAKNRAVDLFRQLKSEKERAAYFEMGSSSIAINELFLDHEIADSQLRMIYTACHPALDPRDQIAFALKTISGFSHREISSALLTKDETIKKRLVRARKAIQSEGIRFEIPLGTDLPKRTEQVLEVLYLLFNEGFHSNRSDILVRKELCGEAMRLTRMVTENQLTVSPDAQALLALMCFLSARLDSKVDVQGNIVDLRNQNRSLWYRPLVHFGSSMMAFAVENSTYSVYHYEAAIAFEHLKAKTFEETNWQNILMWYENLQEVAPSPFHLLNMAVVQLQLGKAIDAKVTLESIDAKQLEQRAYLYYGCWAEYYKTTGEIDQARFHLQNALKHVRNDSERTYLDKKLTALDG